MSTVVHHASMYANQTQLGTGTVAAGTTVLAPKVTAGAPATFPDGLAPSNLTELQTYSVATDFTSGATTAWTDGTNYVDLGDLGKFYWNGTDWLHPHKTATAPASSAITTTGFTVTWTAPVAAGGPSATGYRLKRYATNGTTLQDTIDVAGTVLTYAFTGLTTGTNYKISVTAMQGAYLSAESTKTSITTS